ncbi:MAG TPA: DegT/DnrJ/EryC1/StrS family aminotransferase [Methylomirabilota bacterium]|nr:DegT/DnrJ/EryC1/StrS family aminotransferase [Methylomirabilota bacterium]
MRVPYSYLERQFADNVDGILADIRELVRSGDYTLGAAVGDFEARFARRLGIRHAIGVNSGTEALTLALEAAGVRSGDEVITTPNTFIATVGAIVAAGARPVFVDVNAEHNLDPKPVEEAITPRTRALMPVHLSGNPADMPAIMEIAHRRGLVVVEDACQAFTAAIDGRCVGTFGDAGAFSLHPLKPLNVWGDGGIIVTDSDEMAHHLRLRRNHGLSNRETVEIFGVNSRLDTLQAIVGRHLLDGIMAVTERRIANARRLDRGLAPLTGDITIPPRRPGVRHVYQTYVVQARDRDALVRFLIERGVEAKIHYPVPLHRQPAAKELGYKAGDFPVCEAQAREIVTLPAHQFLTEEEIDYVIAQVQEFYTR